MCGLTGEADPFTPATNSCSPKASSVAKLSSKAPPEGVKWSYMPGSSMVLLYVWTDDGEEIMGREREGMLDKMTGNGGGPVRMEVRIRNCAGERERCQIKDLERRE